MSEREPIFLFGAGGHGRAVSEIIRRGSEFEVAVMLDDNDGATTPYGCPAVSGGRDTFGALADRGPRRGFVAVGNNADRELLTTLLELVGLETVTIIDPAAIVASDATIGTGTVLMPMAFVGAGAKIGAGAIINTSATIDHDCVIEDYAHVSVGVHLAGECVVGSRSFVGIGAVLGGGVVLGQRVMIGAGAAVVSDIADGVVAAGVPARPISSAP